MNDPLDQLKAGLRRTPSPDPSKRDRTIRAAMQSFDDLIQETPIATRHSSEGAESSARLRAGMRAMWNKLTSKAALTATSGLVAAGVAVVVFLPGVPGLDRGFDDGNLVQVELQEESGSGVDPAEDEAIVLGGSSPIVPAPEASAEGRLQQTDTLSLTARPVPTTDQTLAPKVAKKLTSKRKVAKSQGLSAAISSERADIFAADRFVAPTQADREAFASEAPNAVKVVTQDPVSTFSIDVDTASYSVVRQSLMSGRLPPAEAVRVEELVNYFPYDYAGPGGEHPFAQKVSVLQTPWNPDTQLVHVSLQGEMPEISERPPLNLVFLIDSSGSMNSADRLPLLKQSLRMMLPELRPEDQVAIVAYAGSSGLVLEPTPAGERDKILSALDRIQAGGGTAGQAGLQQAYAVAESMTKAGEVSRVLLATDGDFNVGLSDPEALKSYISQKRDSGTYLSVLGFGRGNLDDATMQALAQNGNGQAGYIDTLNEARKVLVDQLTGALFPIAGDVKVQVEFNPVTVAEYRLIGYETRALKREDFKNDKVDAGDIGAGHSVTALYEVTPVGSPAVLNEPLRYGEAVAATNEASDELGFLRLRYKRPGESESHLVESPISNVLGGADAEVQFSVAIAGFGQLLRGTDYLKDWSYADAIALATENRGEDSFGYRSEAIQLMRLADSLQH